MIKYVIIFSLFFQSLLFSKDIFYEKLKVVPIIDDVAINNVKYVEVKANYDRFLSPQIISIAKKCYKNNLKWLKKAEKLYKVNGKVITAILTLESMCGNYHEKYFIAGVYKTLVKLGKDKKYQKKIYNMIKKKYPKTSKKWFLKRVKKKSKWAAKQLNALKEIYEKYGINIFNIKGSWAGAFGLPQFIPTTFLYYAIDGDEDNKIDLTKFPDSIFSIANYLKKHGWKDKLSYKKKFKIILKYNYSKLYADTILKLSEKI